MRRSKNRVAVVAAVSAVGAAVFLAVMISIFGRTDEERLQRQLELGERYLSEMDFERAEAAYTAALEIEPQNVEAACGLARAYAGQEDYEQAESVLMSLIEKLEQGDYRKKQEELYAVLAEIYLESGNTDGAWSAIQRGTDRAAQKEALLTSSDPMKRDTDGDGLFDGTELQNGFDPNLRDTNGDGTPDGKEIFARIVPMPSAMPRENEIYPIVWAEGRGEVYGDFDAVYLKNNATLRGIGSVRGIPCEFSGQSDIRHAKIGFCIPAASAQGAADNMQLAGYDYAQNQLILLDTTVQYEPDGSIIVLSDTAEAGTYMLIDWEHLKRDTDALEYSGIIESGKADVVFVLDTTGSMSTPISNVKENIITFSEYLDVLGVDVRIGIVEYKDIYEDGSGSTVDHGFYYDLDEFKHVLDNFEIGGGGDDYETAVDALEVMSNVDFRSGVSRFAILVTDAPYKDGTQNDSGYAMEQMIETLTLQNICTSVVTYSFFFDVYSGLVSATGGEACDIETDFAAALQTLMDKMGTMVNEGTWVRLTNGSVVCLKENPVLRDASVDTDGDGIPDLEELSEPVTKKYQNSLTGEEIAFEAYSFYSNPALKDSDGDGIADDADARPVQCDFEAGAIDTSGTYLPVETESGDISCGVPEGMAPNSGIAALENILLYLQKHGGYYGLAGLGLEWEGYTLYEIEDLTDQIQNLMDFQEIYTVELDLNLDDIFRNTRKLLKMIKKLDKDIILEEGGCIRGTDMQQCLSACLGDISLSSYCMPFGIYTEGEIYQRIRGDIGRGRPVMLQVGLAGNVDLHENADLSGAAVRMKSMEWLTVTGYEHNGIEGTIVLEVLYKGRIYYLDFQRLMSVDALLGSVVGVE